jgi:hypothetical protein
MAPPEFFNTTPLIEHELHSMEGPPMTTPPTSLATSSDALTDEQIIRLAYQYLPTWDQDTIKFARALIAALPSPANTGEGENSSIAAGVSFAIEWLRNNYQDYPNIASLCDAMRESAPTAAPEQAGVVADELLSFVKKIANGEVQDHMFTSLEDEASSLCFRATALLALARKP